MKFGTILADPPWNFEYWSEKGGATRGFERHYQTQGTDWIASLPVSSVAAKDCTLLLWTLNMRIPHALRVITAWGFEFKSMLTWVKMSRAAAPRIGMGYHARTCTEQLMVASRGNPGAPPPSSRPNGVFFCPISSHSAKPDFQYDLAENYAGPYLEMFHRPREGGLFPPRPGWVFTGNEVDGLDMRDALLRLAASSPTAAGQGRLELGVEG